MLKTDKDKRLNRLKLVNSKTGACVFLKGLIVSEKLFAVFCFIQQANTRKLFLLKIYVNARLCELWAETKRRSSLIYVAAISVQRFYQRELKLAEKSNIYFALINVHLAIY